MEESKWISPMVVKEKKQGGIRICVDFRKLNDDLLHDPFPTPFIDEVLENVGRQESYSFTDGFSRIHQIRIAPKDRHRVHLQQNGDHICIRLFLLDSRMRLQVFHV
jgi:hypothetical protein